MRHLENGSSSAPRGTSSASTRCAKSNDFTTRSANARDSSGFTLVELLVILGMLAVLAVLALPALANGKAGSQQAVCVSNLARIGQALASWGSEHGDLYPWQVSASLGGTRNHPSGLNANSWFQFACISNELATPKILACPSDRLARIPQHFGGGSNGLLNPFYQNWAISYTLSHPYPEDGRQVVATDPSMGGATPGGSCGSTFPGPVYYTHNTASLKWDDILHINSGNLLFNDGSVEQTDTAALKKTMAEQTGDLFPDDTRQSRPHWLYSRPMKSFASEN